MNEVQWYTPKEAATFAKVHIAYIRKWMREGKLPYCELSEKKRVILHGDLVRFVRSRRVSEEKEA